MDGQINRCHQDTPPPHSRFPHMHPSTPPPPIHPPIHPSFPIQRRLCSMRALGSSVPPARLPACLPSLQRSGPAARPAVSDGHRDRRPADRRPGMGPGMDGRTAGWQAGRSASREGAVGERRDVGADDGSGSPVRNEAKCPSRSRCTRSPLSSPPSPSPRSPLLCFSASHGAGREEDAVADGRTDGRTDGWMGGRKSTAEGGTAGRETRWSEGAGQGEAKQLQSPHTLSRSSEGAGQGKEQGREGKQPQCESSPPPPTLSIERRSRARRGHTRDGVEEQCREGDSCNPPLSIE